MARLGRPVRRTTFVVDDATVKLHLYANGFIRIRVDHPSDDILIEVAIANRIIDVLREEFAAGGLPKPFLAEARWRSDPPEATP